MQHAKRHGKPAWLWPEVAIDAWRAALATIAQVSGDALLGRPSALPATLNPGAFGLACYTSGMGPLLGWWQAQGLLDAGADVAHLLDLHARHNAVRNRRLIGTAGMIAARLRAADIAVAFLKGVHTAQAYFPMPGARPMADIDLLVDVRDAVAAEAVMAATGFVRGRRGRGETNWTPPGQRREPLTLMFVHQDDPWSIDLHHSLDQHGGTGAPPTRFDAARPMDALVPLPGGSGGLDQPLLLLHLTAHAGGGLHNLTLLRLAELCLVIRRDIAAGRLSWDAMIAVGEQTGALGYAYPALRMCDGLVPGTVPALVIEACAAAAPAAVRRVVETLTPATAQRVDRSSIAEHFMWSAGWTGLARQLAADLVPIRSLGQSWSIYERRVWQVLRGRISA